MIKFSRTPYLRSKAPEIIIGKYYMPHKNNLFLHTHTGILNRARFQFRVVCCNPLINIFMLPPQQNMFFFLSKPMLCPLFHFSILNKAVFLSSLNRIHAIQHLLAVSVSGNVPSACSTCLLFRLYCVENLN